MELLTALLTSDRGIATEVLTESGVTLDVIRHAGAGSNEGSSNNFDDDAEILKSIGIRSEEHTSELQSLMRISYAVFCLKKTKHTIQPRTTKLTTHNKIN